MEHMRDYQRMKNNYWIIPHNIYMMTLYFIRSIDELEDEYNTIMESSPEPVKGPKGTKPGDPTAMKAERLEKVHDSIQIIKSSLNKVPEEYREEVWSNIIDREPFDVLKQRTLSRHKARYIREVAERKGFL